MAVNENLAQLSNTFMYSAIAVYTLAFFAAAAEWTFGSRSRVARQSAAIGAQGAAAGTRAAGAADAADGDGAGGAADTGPGGRDDGGGVAVAVQARPVVVARDEGHDGGAADDFGDVTRGDDRADRLGRIAVSLTVLAFLLHAASVVCRGLAVSRAPWGNMYEFSTAVALVVVGAFLALLWARPVRWLSLFVLLPVITTLGVAVTILYTESEQLVPALHSYWLWIHVATAIVSFGAFHIGALASILFLFRESHEKRVAAGTATRRVDGMLERLPTSAALDKTAYRVNAVIFPLWTFAIVAGAVWAENAWGRYWGWDAKETWSFITWVAYAAYLHARATAGWKGRKAAYLSLVAFACFLFNYYGVNIFINGLHSYAGV